MEEQKKTAVITGASSGLGLESAKIFLEKGFSVMMGARRVDRLEKMYEEQEADVRSRLHFSFLDVQDDSSIENFVKKAQQECGSIDLLVNNAGLALGVDHLADADPQDWTTMMDVNFIGAMKMTRAILPFMKDHSGARIIHIASIAGREAYEGGGGYCASKAAMKSMSRSLRLELLDRGIGVSCIDPGLVETEFSRVRFRGDEEKAKAVYAGVEALTAKDVAKTIAFVAMQEAHVNIDDVLITPMAQGFTKRTIRKTQS